MPAAAKKLTAPQDLVEVFDVEQGSEEWRRLRLGLPTSSRFAHVLAEGDGKVRTKYLYQLAGEILSGEPAEDFKSPAMVRGNEMESEAREWYARTRFADLTPVGFVRRTVRAPLGNDFMIGASPDSEISKRKGLELKTEKPELLIARLERGAGGFPSEHRAQIMGTMLCKDYEEMDLVCFYRGMPTNAVFTVERDEVYIRRLREELERFDYDLRMLVNKIRAMGK
jgi:hypothetical protein